MVTYLKEAFILKYMQISFWGFPEKSSYRHQYFRHASQICMNLQKETIQARHCKSTASLLVRLETDLPHSPSCLSMKPWQRYVKWEQVLKKTITTPLVSKSELCTGTILISYSHKNSDNCRYSVSITINTGKFSSLKS